MEACRQQQPGAPGSELNKSRGDGVCVCARVCPAALAETDP